MLKNQSVATIAAPEFLNIEPYNPLISQCEIKVLYVGENRNGSFITKEVAKNMANSLPGTPIVAAFIKDKDDFGDHGHVITIEDGEVKFSCKTQPYGFVAPDAKVWFKEFTDTDEFGNEINREYLMTNGYLWTGQYPEIQKAIDEGMPQSMELDEASLDGHWAMNHSSGVEFFIINDATFSKLCILGSDVEPCFEGASVTDKQVSKEFSANPEFMTTLFSMMNDLKEALQYNEGGSDMEDTQVEEVQETEFAEEKPADEVAPAAEVVEEPSEDFACGSDKKKYADEKKDEEEESADEPADDAADDEEAEDEKKKPASEHSLEEVEAEFAALKAEHETTVSLLDAANAELESLRAYKLGIENQQKDALIAKYYMLSDEVREQISSTKAEYSIDEIEAQLALAFVKENVNFESVDGQKVEAEVEEESPITTFSLDEAVDTTFVSPALQALRNA